MRILVTNDDGIESEGIHVLARALASTEHEVVVVAPDRNWSGAGAALGDLEPGRALDVARVEIPGAPAVEAYALAGPPALTVVASRLGAFGAPADLVVSGINAGLNTGRSILHSGTVGAVLTGQGFGVSGLAVSVASSSLWHWDTAAQVALEVLPLVISAPPRSALNLNVPARPRSEVAGIRWARIAPFGAVRAQVGSTSATHVDVVLQATGYEPAPDTDQGCVDRGYAALTTLVGVVEAWPDPLPGDEPSYAGSLVPGADLHEVHEVPDATDHRLLRRPHLGD
ncbi:MAG: 5'/3'-nucleotidase SurE [Actinobacteria bacterium]|nr:5'/3'-nucleotidase SurE [Actinomycetota bacterium]